MNSLSLFFYVFGTHTALFSCRSYIYIYMHYMVYVYIYTHTHIHTATRVGVIYIYILYGMCVYIYTHIHTHTHTNTTHTHAHTHTHTHMLPVHQHSGPPFAPQVCGIAAAARNVVLSTGGRFLFYTTHGELKNHLLGVRGNYPGS